MTNFSREIDLGYPRPSDDNLEKIKIGMSILVDQDLDKSVPDGTEDTNANES